MRVSMKTYEKLRTLVIGAPLDPLSQRTRQHIALAGQINTEHRAGQHLRHRSFRHDLFLFRHCAKYNRGRCVAQPPAVID